MIDIAIKYHSDINMQISETRCHISNKYIYNIITSQNHKLVVFLLENLQQCSMLVTTKYSRKAQIKTGFKISNKQIKLRYIEHTDVRFQVFFINIHV